MNIYFKRTHNKFDKLRKNTIYIYFINNYNFVKLCYNTSHYYIHKKNYYIPFRIEKEKIIYNSMYEHMFDKTIIDGIKIYGINDYIYNKKITIFKHVLNKVKHYIL